MLDELRANIETEEKLAVELVNFLNKAEYANSNERELILGMVNSLKNRLKLVNGAVSNLVLHVSLAKKFNDVKRANFKEIEEENKRVSINKKDSVRYEHELRISKDLIRRLNKKRAHETVARDNYRGAGLYSRFANGFFLNTSQKWLKRGDFKSLISDLKKSNLNILSSTYISLMIMSTVIGFLFGIVLTTVLVFVGVSSSFPFIGLYDGGYLFRLLKLSWLVLVIPLGTWFSLYLYPGAEKRSVGSRIDQELPFVVIQMGSISGSGIEPVEIFKIIGTSEDYKCAGKEIIKLLNQINIYGYDLVTALNNVSRTTPSIKLSELLGGLSTTISSGGDLGTFFEKRADTLLNEYALEREKFTKVAETFMDIYISVVIATPMILLLLLVMISVSGISLGVDINVMSFLIIFVVAIVNVLFLIFLHLKQPNY
ncbi:hypothetical protein AUJ84_00495 [Candidatus Pacearchaeota archaeon CG1_02_32_132]|nr:MAG: hypothetical protein AUJ84_00495 [Candidatus Pacearchaeota archaeon CG1_02_32_132]